MAFGRGSGYEGCRLGPLTVEASYVAVARRVNPAKPSALRDPARAVRVVIADDDVEVRTLVDFILRQDPAVLLVGEAEDGESAIILVRQVQPDLVIMDVMMPGVGGLEATRRIKREWPDTRVLVLTNLTDDETRRSAFVNGADSFLTKRDIATRLLAAIKDTIQA
jgi:two-component system, NarL family, invasion response regulator UvrY